MNKKNSGVYYALFLLTDLIAGDNVVIQPHEPKTAKDTSKLAISKVIQGYINMFPTEATAKTAKYDCHNDVACYPEWETEANSVALILLSSGNYWCSGTLANNTKQAKRPFFLSAFRCIDTDSDPDNLSEEVNLENFPGPPQCFGLTCFIPSASCT
ncbi:MAG: hypothetical protein K2O66_00870 [Bacteroidales bacterium]|nr:hypothetical protein [Bacteroidales bacterium]MDE7071901.1 hypothetical protein [Bacteroidales bacterium]